MSDYIVGETIYTEFQSAHIGREVRWNRYCTPMESGIGILVYRGGGRGNFVQLESGLEIEIHSYQLIRKRTKVPSETDLVNIYVIGEDIESQKADGIINKITERSPLKTIMSKLTTVWSNLTLSADEKLLRELGLHDSDGKPTSEYFDLQSAIIAKEYQAKVLEEAKKVKEELDSKKKD